MTPAPWWQYQPPFGNATTYKYDNSNDRAILRLSTGASCEGCHILPRQITQLEATWKTKVPGAAVQHGRGGGWSFTHEGLLRPVDGDGVTSLGFIAPATRQANNPKVGQGERWQHITSHRITSPDHTTNVSSTTQPGKHMMLQRQAHQ